MNKKFIKNELENNEIIQQKYDFENNDNDFQICNITIHYEKLKENKNTNDVSNSIVTIIYDLCQ